jgi:tRNA G26 N,N-dimethylase Trm1
MTEATDKLLKDFDKALADYPLLMTKNQTAGVLNVSVASINRLLAVGQLERVGFQMSATKMYTTKPSAKLIVINNQRYEFREMKPSVRKLGRTHYPVLV